nr:phosphoglycerate transporter [Cryobacterium sp. Y50]
MRDFLTGRVNATGLLRQAAAPSLGGAIPVGGPPYGQRPSRVLVRPYDTALYDRAVELPKLIQRIETRRQEAARLIVVGVSGYCGSGKSTLTRQLVAQLPGAVRIRGDDFLDPARSHKRSADWDGVERLRLVSEVLTPVRDGRPSMFRRYDWSSRKLGVPERLPYAEILVVDLIGLFHPDAFPLIDLAIWCDVDLETSAQRGINRDARMGRNHDALWHDVWLPNERDFEDQFAPRTLADVVYPTSG